MDRIYGHLSDGCEVFVGICRHDDVMRPIRCQPFQHKSVDFFFATKTSPSFISNQDHSLDIFYRMTKLGRTKSYQLER